MGKRRVSISTGEKQVRQAQAMMKHHRWMKGVCKPLTKKEQKALLQSLPPPLPIEEIKVDVDEADDILGDLEEWKPPQEEQIESEPEIVIVE